ncbi:MAG: tRNA (adenosine(37)-N6)-threonylcarbamoyltransferase complex ATPase subunit type 1 TsaE [Candidatus Peribacteraceae bacterium]|nr:tRNA (adenosine(37)-N6)-threonylcarbamoyltransferase complex ATPase subunit type 1 TsaE [Candidatus Peribacteraceae bacterium]
MLDTSTVQARNEELMRKTGISLAATIYRRPATIVLRGELGAGKTTFVQGLAAGLGITERITSPTYALEQRYGGETLSHIDLYRLTPVQATEFFRTLDPFPGLRVIEWSDRTAIEPDIEIDIAETGEGRSIAVSFRDIAVPMDSEVDAWMELVTLPEHIRKHVRKVAEVAEKVADAVELQGRIVRKKALRAAALSHDLLRFVDFASMTGDDVYSPAPHETDTWITMKKSYGTPHEVAAQKFLEEHGYPDIGHIVLTHRGYGQSKVPETIEQLILAYSDKRAIIDSVVTLDERFDDFIVRYGKGKESDDARAWRAEIKLIETKLFPDGAPF